MKWFHHDSDFRHKESIAKLRSEFGFEGVGRYWTICEIVAEQMDYSDKCFAEFPEKKWLSELSIRRPLFRRYLQVIGQLFDNKVITTGALIRIEMPNLLCKKDNHSRNLQAKLKKIASKEIDKEKEKEKPKTLKTSPPDITILINHFKIEYEKAYMIKPNISGAHGKIFQSQLSKRGIDELKQLITLYLEDSDSFLVERAHPIELFVNRINLLMVKLKKVKDWETYKKKVHKEVEIEEALKIILPPMNGSEIIWKECLQEIEPLILPESFTTWITPLSPLGNDEKTLFVNVPNKFFKKCLNDNYKEMILENIGNGLDDIKFLIPGEYNECKIKRVEK